MDISKVKFINVLYAVAKQKFIVVLLAIIVLYKTGMMEKLKNSKKEKHTILKHQFLRKRNIMKIVVKNKKLKQLKMSCFYLQHLHVQIV